MLLLPLVPGGSVGAWAGVTLCWAQQEQVRALPTDVLPFAVSFESPAL